MSKFRKPGLEALIASLSIQVQYLQENQNSLQEKQNSSDLRLDAIEERCALIEEEVSQVMDRNEELSWVACPFDAEGKSCEDYLQESEE